MILSAFYYGYIFTHIPGGLLAQRYGGKHTLGLGILSTGIFTMMTPWVADMGATAMVVLRICMGLGEVSFHDMAAYNIYNLGEIYDKNTKRNLSNALIHTGNHVSGLEYAAGPMVTASREESTIHRCFRR